MTRLNWMAGVTAALMFAVLSSVGVARAQDTSSPDLVRTACEYGNLTECGSLTVGTQCSYTWGFEIGIIAKVLGINYNGQKCEGATTKKLYKDYEKGKNDFGVCIAYPSREPAPQDVTGAPRDGEYDDSSTC